MKYALGFAVVVVGTLTALFIYSKMSGKKDAKTNVPPANTAAATKP